MSVLKNYQDAGLAVAGIGTPEKKAKKPLDIGLWRQKLVVLGEGEKRKNSFRIENEAHYYLLFRKSEQL